MVSTLGSSIKDASYLVGKGVKNWPKFAHGKTADMVKGGVARCRRKNYQRFLWKAPK